MTLRDTNPRAANPRDAAKLIRRAIALTRFAGRAGDHNGRAMVASGILADVLAERLGADVTTIGEPAPPLSTSWDIELTAAMPALRAMTARYEAVFDSGRLPVTALSRCAVALATLPVVASHRPDAVVVWFDAHADLNTPDETTTGYLGGLALSGPLGRWDSGLGRGLEPDHVALVGARDIDPAEQRLIADGTVALVPVGPTMADDLATVVGGRPVYVHIDCDVLDAGTVPTDYLVPDGMSLAQLRDCATALARSEIVGIEVGELETSESDEAAATVSRRPAENLVAALGPIFDELRR